MSQYTLTEILERFEGTFAGVAIGDALGNPVEGFTQEHITSKHSIVNDYITHWDEAGTYTDDTELTLAVADSLIKVGAFSSNALAAEFKLWLRNAKSFGVACQAAVVNLANGIPPDYSGVYSPGNGAAMRTSPIGLFFSHPADKKLLRRSAIACARITHTHPDAVGSALVVSSAVAYLLQNPELRTIEFLSHISRDAKRISKPLADKISSLEETLEMSENKAAKKLGTSGNSLDSVPFAIYCFLKSPNAFEQTIIRAVNVGGDTDTNASIACALSGAYNGINAISQKWKSGLKDYEKVIQTARGLFELYKSCLPKSEKDRIRLYDDEIMHKKALEERDFNKAAHYAGEIASFHGLNGNIHRGIVLFREALAYPNLGETQRCLLQLLLAKSYGKIGETKKAIDTLCGYKSTNPWHLATRDLLINELLTSSDK